MERRHGTPNPVAHMCVDLPRTAVPISGRAIRADVAAHREQVDVVVWADLQPRVAILGGESSGKSTLALALASRLSTVWVPEYGRELWERQRGRLAFDDMLHIAQEQLARERRGATLAGQWLICDTTPLTTMFYSQDSFGRVDAELARLVQRDYNLTVLCAPDFEFMQDGTRRDAAFRARQHWWYLAQLRQRRQPFLLVQGSVSERVDAVVRRLAAPSPP